MATGNSVSKTFVWILLGLAMLGLGGFGATNLSGTIRTIGTVGDKHINVDEYARQLNQEMRAIEAQTGERLPFARAQEIGLDRMVLQRMVSARALDHEAAQLGLSIGDESLRDEIVKIPAFQGIDGTFDRESYTFALERSGMSEAEFETSLREEATRSLLQSAIINGTVMSDTYITTVLEYIGETRDVTWARLSLTDLEDPLPTPDEEELKAYFEAHPDDFMLPETKQITYAYLSPEMMLDSVEVPEEEMRAEYEARSEEYNRPERRLVERLVFLDAQKAEQAAAALEVESATFETLVEDRGLSLSDVDLGDVDQASLAEAGEAVFAAAVGDVVGPLPSDLGPALFRVNGVLQAQHTSFEEAKPQLRDFLATDRARRQISARAQEFDDLLAGGATLEELASETEMTLGSIDWNTQSDEDIAAYTDFFKAAQDLTAEDYPQILPLDDGGVFAMRLEKELPERPSEFQAAREKVITAWEDALLEEQLNAKAQALLPQLEAGAEFEDLGLSATLSTDQSRRSFINGTPSDFMQKVFEMAPGDVTVMNSFGTVLIVRLDQISTADENENAQDLRQSLKDQVEQTLASDLYTLYSTDTVLRAGQNIDPRALTAVHVNFP